MSIMDRPDVFERILIGFADEVSPETVFAIGELSAASQAWDRAHDILLADVRAGRAPKGDTL